MIWRSSSSFSTTMMTFLPSLRPEQRHLDEAGVLVTVADDEAARLVLHREAGEQFGLAAHLEAEIEAACRRPGFPRRPRGVG